MKIKPNLYSCSAKAFAFSIVKRREVATTIPSSWIDAGEESFAMRAKCRTYLSTAICVAAETEKHTTECNQR